MKSAALYQILAAGTVTLTAAKPCKKLAPFPDAPKFHTNTLEDAIADAAEDPGFHDFINQLTETFHAKPGSTYELTPDGGLAETDDSTVRGGSPLVVINDDGKKPTLLLGNKNGTSSVTLGDLPLGIGGSYPTGYPTGNPIGYPPGYPTGYPIAPFPTAPGGSDGGNQGGSSNGTIPGIPSIPSSTASNGNAASSTVSDAASSGTASSAASSTVSSSASLTTAAASSTASSTISTSSTSSSTSSTSSSTSSTSSSTSSSATSAPTAGCTNPETYVEWRNMKDADKKSYVTAVRCLMDKPPTGLAEQATNRYEELVWAHQIQSNNIHMSGIFMPWHRYYTNVFHRLIRQECGYTAPIPWWDETKDAGKFAGSGLFTRDYFGAMPEVTSSGMGTCITDGAFAGKKLHIGPGSGYSTYCLSRGEDSSSTSQVTKAYVNLCTSRSQYDDLRSCIEGGPHAYGHNGAGPVMGDAISSPSDPLFFMHHTFIDWTWKTWQDKQALTRTVTINGYADRSSSTPLTVSTKLSSRGVQAEVTVEDILNTEGGYLCYKYDY